MVLWDKGLTPEQGQGGTGGGDLTSLYSCCRGTPVNREPRESKGSQESR